jgi:hypothetical protein
MEELMLVKNRIARLGGALVAATAVAIAALPTAAQATSQATWTSVAAPGEFTFHSCADAGSFCLTDHVQTDVPGLGHLDGTFEVVIDFARSASDGCAPIRKSGAFTAANGDTVAVSAVGTFCDYTASYAFTVDSGTGQFKHAHGGGQWLVPPATGFTASGGSGPEYLSGSLVWTKQD